MYEMKIASSLDSRLRIFEQKLEEIKNDFDEDEIILFDNYAHVIKTIYVDKILTNVSILYKRSSYVLQIEINLPKLIYDTREYFILVVYTKSFTDKTILVAEFYELFIDRLRSSIESKVCEHYIYHRESCSIFDCESPLKSKCQKLRKPVFLSLLCGLPGGGKDSSSHIF